MVCSLWRSISLWFCPRFCPCPHVLPPMFALALALYFALIFQDKIEGKSNRWGQNTGEMGTWSEICDVNSLMVRRQLNKKKWKFKVKMYRSLQCIGSYWSVANYRLPSWFNVHNQNQGPIWRKLWMSISWHWRNVWAQIDLGLLPLITKPTKKYHTSATLIDHIFASKTNNNINVAVLKDSALADHFDTPYIEDIGYDFLCLLYGSVGKDGGEKL